MVRSENRRVPRQVVKVVHDDSHKEVEHEEGGEEDKGNKVDVGHARAARLGLVAARRLVKHHRVRIAGPPRIAGEHDTRPRFPRRTPVCRRESVSIKGRK